ncbi:MAG: hypothetical protein V3T23_00435, partial [Nitrososphaerales archaeon]
SAMSLLLVVRKGFEPSSPGDHPPKRAHVPDFIQLNYRSMAALVGFEPTLSRSYGERVPYQLADSALNWSLSPGQA